jgi:hypothetical protein
MARDKPASPAASVVAAVRCGVLILMCAALFLFAIRTAVCDAVTHARKKGRRLEGVVDRQPVEHEIVDGET